MFSSVTVKALQSGWDGFSQMAGFFSAATDICPVIGAELMCRALAMADSRVPSPESGPTPAERDGLGVRGQRSGLRRGVSWGSRRRLTLQAFGQVHGPQHFFCDV